MGRPRKHGRHLPRRMYLRRGAYYFVDPKGGAWVPLGKDLAEALAEYGRLVAGSWAGRTIGDAIDRYRTEVTPAVKNEKSRDEQGVALTRLKEVFGLMPQDSLTAQHLYQYIDRRRDTREKFRHLNRPAKTAAKHEVAILRMVLAKGIRWGVGTTNAAVGIEFDAPDLTKRDVTQAEVDAVRQLADPRMKIAIDLAQLIAQRRGDLLSLKWSDVEGGVAAVTQNKTGERLDIIRTAAFDEVLARAKAMKPDIPKVYVLRNRAGQPYTGDGFGANWQRLMRKAMKAGVIQRRFKFKDLRAKAAQDVTDSDGLQAAQDLLGHTSPATTKKHYVARLPARRVKPVR